MARDHARVELSIWADDDWLDLTPGAQHLYLVILTHPDRSFAGLVDWRPNRLRAMASHWDPDDFKRAAEELARNLYLVVDEETEEVLIRSFVRHDGLMKQPNMAVAMVKAARSIASRGIRAVLVHELLRLREDEPDLKGWAAAEELLSGRSADPSGYPTGYPSGNPSGNPSGKGESNPSDNPSPTPYSILHTPDSPLHAPAADAASGARKRADYSPEFEAFWAAYPRKEAKRQAWKAWGKAIERATPEQIKAGASRYADDPNRSEQFTKHGSTWLNADGWEDEPLPSASGRGNTNDARSTPKGYDPADWLRKDNEPAFDYIDAEVVQLREIGR